MQTKLAPVTARIKERPMRWFLMMLLAAMPAPANAQDAEVDYRSAAFEMVEQIEQGYAYRDRFEDEIIPFTPALQREAEEVDDARSLLVFAERMLLALRDHHAITGSSLANSWAVIPTYADLWIDFRDGQYLVDAVRTGSPAAAAGITPGMTLVRVGDDSTAEAVAAFWNDIGLQGPDAEARGFAARVLAAGRRDRARHLTFAADGTQIAVELPSLYAVEQAPLPPVTLEASEDVATIRINNSLGDTATIAAFDAAMAQAASSARIVLDLTETPSGGNTTIARAIMGWFTDEPRPYQVHSLPAEQRQTGIARQWTEYVLPREGKFYSGPVTVRVGRWTGSMGEGLAIGMRALGAGLEGGQMAGLLGAIYDLRLETGLLFKLPVERLEGVDGTAREHTPVGAGKP